MKKKQTNEYLFFFVSNQNMMRNGIFLIRTYKHYLLTYIVLQTWKSQIKSIEPLNRKWNTSYVYHIVISMQTIANNWFLPTTTTNSHIQYYTKPQQTTEYLIRIYWYFAIVCFNAILIHTTTIIQTTYHTNHFSMSFNSIQWNLCYRSISAAAILVHR